MFADPTYTSFCDLSATMSCTQVYASRFGTFHGVSVSVFGAIWFAFAALLSVAGVAGSLLGGWLPHLLRASARRSP